VEQTDLLRYAIDALERLGIPYAIVGSFASGVWGESRFTQDIDILIDIAQSQIPALCAAFPSDKFYVSDSAAREAVNLGGQFNVIHPASGNKIDFMIAGDNQLAAAQLQRAQRVALLADREGAVAAPEDVILGKLLYFQVGGSDKHLRDIAGILKISGDFLDRDYVAKFAAQLGLSDAWQAILARVVNE
jgi:hypothetical protein